MEYSVDELLKSPSGRAHLADLQKRHWKDILQPSDPRFDKVYGKQVKDTQEKMDKNKRKANEMREEISKKKEWELKNKWRTR